MTFKKNGQGAGEIDSSEGKEVTLAAWVGQKTFVIPA